MTINTENELELFYQKYEEEGLDLRSQPGRTLAGKVFNMYRFNDMLPEEIKDMTLKQQLQAVYLTESELENEPVLNNIQCSLSVDEQIERELVMENEIANMILSPSIELSELLNDYSLDSSERSKEDVEKAASGSRLALDSEESATRARATLLARYILERVLEEFRPDLF